MYFDTSLKSGRSTRTPGTTTGPGGDKTLVVKLWLHRVADDLSGLTFQKWDPSEGTDNVSAPVTMIVNSSDL